MQMKEAYDFEWKQWGSIESLYDSEEEMIAEYDRYGIPEEIIKNKYILDAGCGFGRSSYYLLKKGAKYVIGIDISDNVYNAINLCDLRKSMFFKASVLNDLDFKKDSFDTIISFGVLHFTGDMPRAIKNLSKYLKPGGFFYIYVIGKPKGWKEKVRYWTNKPIRFITTRMPDKMLVSFCNTLYDISNIPVIKYPFRLIFTISHKKPKKRAVASIFDWHNPPYVSYHSIPEVMKMMADAGLNIRHQTSSHGVCVVGIKTKVGGGQE